jgi:uncharacterized protein with GYD domain
VTFANTVRELGVRALLGGWDLPAPSGLICDGGVSNS